MEADIIKNNRSVITNISKATPEQRQKIDSDIEQLKAKYPEKGITSRVEGDSLIIEATPVVTPTQQPEAIITTDTIEYKNLQ